MKLSELYRANYNWSAMSTLILVDEDLAIIEDGIGAYFADFFYGQHEVASFQGDLVILKNLKEDKTNE